MKTKNKLMRLIALLLSVIMLATAVDPVPAYAKVDPGTKDGGSKGGIKTDPVGNTTKDDVKEFTDGPYYDGVGGIRVLYVDVYTAPKSKFTTYKEFSNWLHNNMVDDPNLACNGLKFYNADMDNTSALMARVAKIKNLHCIGNIGNSTVRNCLLTMMYGGSDSIYNSLDTWTTFTQWLVNYSKSNGGKVKSISANEFTDIKDEYKGAGLADNWYAVVSSQGLITFDYQKKSADDAPSAPGTTFSIIKEFKTKDLVGSTNTYSSLNSFYSNFEGRYGVGKSYIHKSFARSLNGSQSDNAATDDWHVWFRKGIDTSVSPQKPIGGYGGYFGVSGGKYAYFRHTWFPYGVTNEPLGSNDLTTTTTEPEPELYNFTLRAWYQNMTMDVANMKDIPNDKYNSGTRSDFEIEFTNKYTGTEVRENKYYLIDVAYKNATDYSSPDSSWDSSLENTDAGYGNWQLRLSSKETNAFTMSGMNNISTTVVPDKTGHMYLALSSERFKELVQGNLSLLFGMTVIPSSEQKTANRMWHPVEIGVRILRLDSMPTTVDSKLTSSKAWQTVIPLSPGLDEIKSDSDYHGYRVPTDKPDVAQNYNDWHANPVMKEDPMYRHIPWETHSTYSPKAYAEIVANVAGKNAQDWNVMQGIPSTENVSVVAGGNFALWDFGGYVHIYGNPYNVEDSTFAGRNGTDLNPSGEDYRDKSIMTREIRIRVDVMDWWGETNAPCELECKGGHTATVSGSYSVSSGTSASKSGTCPHCGESVTANGTPVMKVDDEGNTTDEVDHYDSVTQSHSCSVSATVKCSDDSTSPSISGKGTGSATKTLRSNEQGYDGSVTVTDKGGCCTKTENFSYDLLEKGYTKGKGCKCKGGIINMMHHADTETREFSIFESLDVYAWKEITTGQIWQLEYCDITDVDDRVFDKLTTVGRATSSSTGQNTIQRYVGLGQYSDMVTLFDGLYQDDDGKKSPAMMWPRFVFTDFRSNAADSFNKYVTTEQGIAATYYQSFHSNANNKLYLADYYYQDAYVWIQVYADSGYSCSKEVDGSPNRLAIGTAKELDKCDVHELNGQDYARWDESSVTSKDVTYKTAGIKGDRASKAQIESEILHVVNAWQYYNKEDGQKCTIGVKSDAVTLGSHWKGHVENANEVGYFDVVNAFYLVDDGIELFNYGFQSMSDTVHYRSHQSKYSVDALSSMVEDNSDFSVAVNTDDIVLGYGGIMSSDPLEKYGLFGKTYNVQLGLAMDYYEGTQVLGFLHYQFSHKDNIPDSRMSGYYDLLTHAPATEKMLDGRQLWRNNVELTQYCVDGGVLNKATVDFNPNGHSTLGTDDHEASTSRQAGTMFNTSWNTWGRIEGQPDQYENEIIKSPEALDAYYGRKKYETIVSNGFIGDIYTWQAGVDKFNNGWWEAFAKVSDNGSNNQSKYKVPFVISNIPIKESAENGVYSDSIEVNANWVRTCKFNNESTEFVDGKSGVKLPGIDENGSVLVDRSNGKSSEGTPTFSKKCIYAKNYKNVEGEGNTVNDIVIHNPISVEGWRLISNNYGSYDAASLDESGEDARYYIDEDGNEYTIDGEFDKDNYLVVGNTFHLWVSDYGNFRDPNGSWDVSTASQSLGVASNYPGYDPTTGSQTGRAEAKGYTDNMKTSDWIAYRYVKFPFPVSYKKYENGVMSTVVREAGSLIDLSEVPATTINASSGKENSRYNDYVLRYGSDRTQSTVTEVVKDKDNNTKTVTYKTDRTHYSSGANCETTKDQLFHQAPDKLENMTPTDGTFYYGLDFEFTILPSAREQQGALIAYYAVAINHTDDGVVQQTDSNNTRNEDYAAASLIYKIDTVDVVGRIGNLALEDVGDFRYSELFKNIANPQSWLIPGVVHRVDIESPRNIIATDLDILGNNTKLGKTANHATSSITNFVIGDNPGYGKAGPYLQFPLVSSVNPIEEYRREQMRMGYKAYLDIETMGNYYGVNYVLNSNGERTGVMDRGPTSILDTEDNRYNTVTIIPKYYLYDPPKNAGEEGKFYSIYMYYGNAGARTKFWGDDEDITYKDDICAQYVDLPSEASRRNVTNAEKQINWLFFGSGAGSSANVVSALDQEDYIGTASKLVLDQYDRTYIGSTLRYGCFDQKQFDTPGLLREIRTTLGTSWLGDDMRSDNKACPNGLFTFTSPGENRGLHLSDDDFLVQQQRWYFTLGLPSSTYITYADKNIDSQLKVEASHKKLLEEHPDGVVVCYLDIKASGQVWNLKNYASQAMGKNYEAPIIIPKDPTKPEEPLPISKPEDPIKVLDKDGNVVKTIDPDWQPTIVYDSEYTSAQDWDTYGTH